MQSEVKELRAMAVDRVRRIRLAEKQLRAWALAYDAGEIDAAELLLSSLRYAAEVRVYRQIEAALLDVGVRVPKAVRDGASRDEDWASEVDAEVTQPCAVRRMNTLQ